MNRGFNLPAWRQFDNSNPGRCNHPNKGLFRSKPICKHCLAAVSQKLLDAWKGQMHWMLRPAYRFGKHPAMNEINHLQGSDGVAMIDEKTDVLIMKSRHSRRKGQLVFGVMDRSTGAIEGPQYFLKLRFGLGSIVTVGVDVGQFSIRFPLKRFIYVLLPDNPPQQKLASPECSLTAGQASGSQKELRAIAIECQRLLVICLCRIR